jgi:hypothetical protein
MGIEVKLAKSHLLIVLLLLFGVSSFQNVIAIVESAGTNTLFMPIITQGDPVWPIGPDGGHIVALAIDPSNSSIMYAGTWGAGIYKSTNGGSSWRLSNSGLENYYINIIAIDPVRWVEFISLPMEVPHGLLQERVLIKMRSSIPS